MHTRLTTVLLMAVLPSAACRKEVTEAQARTARDACTFKAGALPNATLATNDPVGSQIPIDHIVLMMQENRSFDAYFSKLTVPGQTIEAASDTATNPDAQGNPVSRFHWSASTAGNGHPDGLDYYCFGDTEHGWDGTHAEYDDGKIDGFVTANAPGNAAAGSGARAMGYYDEDDIPFYYSLARAFAISDHHFCSLLGPTWPNRMFFMAGTSFGLTNNVFPPETDPQGNPYPNIFLELAAAHVSWKVYYVALPSPTIFPAILNDFGGKYASNFAPLTQFALDAQAGHLPDVALVEGADSGQGDAIDEHPPQDMQVGEAFVESIVRALLASPQWSRSAMFITYDEHGGQYDHVAPPTACKPDALPTQLTSQDHLLADFDRFGFRTPLFVISPFARRHFVSHVPVDHTSITRFIEARFNLPAMTARDANAWPLYDMFDFEHPDTSVPDLASSIVEPAQRTQCLADFPPASGGF
jgi:phospholipase C